MKINKFQLLAFSGILGSLLMFTGDMLLYYEAVSGIDYDSTARMSNMPINRLMAGGLIGPFASAFSIMGAYLFYLVFRPVNKLLASIMFVCLGFLFIVGGTYHAMFPNFGFVGRLPEEFRGQQIQFIRTYLKNIIMVIYLAGTIWTLLLFYMVIFKKTLYPIWMLFFTPTLLILLAGIIKNHVPYPLGVIIYGGWINLCFMLFFIVCFLHFSRKSIKDPINMLNQIKS